MKSNSVLITILWICIILFLPGCKGCESSTSTGTDCHDESFTLYRTDDGYKGTMEVPVIYPPGKNLKKISITESNKKYIKKIICTSPDPSKTGNTCTFFYPDNFYREKIIYYGNSFVESVSGEIITYTAENTKQTIKMATGDSGDSYIIKENENCPCTKYDGNWKIEVLFSKEYYTPETVSKKLKVCFYFE